LLLRFRHVVRIHTPEARRVDAMFRHDPDSIACLSDRPLADRELSPVGARAESVRLGWNFDGAPNPVGAERHPMNAISVLDSSMNVRICQGTRLSIGFEKLAFIASGKATG